MACLRAPPMHEQVCMFGVLDLLWCAALCSTAPHSNLQIAFPCEICGTVQGSEAGGSDAASVEKKEMVVVERTAVALAEAFANAKMTVDGNCQAEVSESYPAVLPLQGMQCWIRMQMAALVRCLRWSFEAVLSICAYAVRRSRKCRG